jgi:hypothetical protein
MFPQELIKTAGENRTALMDTMRMCPRCLEEGRVAWVRVDDPYAHAKPCGDQDRQYCERCNSTWDFVECPTLAAWMEGLMKSMAILEYDGSDLSLPGRVQCIMDAQEQRQQDVEKSEPKMKMDTRHGW